MKYWIGALVIVVLSLGTIVLARDLFTSDTPTFAPLPHATAFPIEEPFWGKVKNFTAVKERVLEVKIKLLNTGNNPGVGECDLIAYDKKGAVVSLPVTTGEPAEPGYGVPITQRLKIEEGADTIQRVEVDC